VTCKLINTCSARNNKTVKYKKKEKKDSLRYQYKAELKQTIREGSKSLKYVDSEEIASPMPGNLTRLQY